jgi:hypothetical protein
MSTQCHIGHFETLEPHSMALLTVLIVLIAIKRLSATPDKRLVPSLNSSRNSNALGRRHFLDLIHVHGQGECNIKIGVLVHMMSQERTKEEPAS